MSRSKAQEAIKEREPGATNTPMTQSAGLGSAFAALATVPSAVESLRAEFGRLVDVVERLEQRLPAPLVSLDAYAQLAGISRATAKRQLIRGDLRATRVGRRWRIDVSDLRPMSRDGIAAAAAKVRSGK